MCKLRLALVTALCVLLFGSVAAQTFQSDSIGEEREESPTFKFDGHYITTNSVARRAGMSADDEWVVTVFSQVPDDVVFLYSAVPVAVWGVFWPPYRHRIVNTLHSLHGGDSSAVAIRRGRLVALIKALDLSSTEDLWKAGLLVHALGDSFAHIYVKHGEEHAYNELYGHAIDSLFGSDPDVIDGNFTRYRDYLFALYGAFERPSVDSEARRAAFEAWACDLTGAPASIKRKKLLPVERELGDALPFSIFNDFLAATAASLDQESTEDEAQLAKSRYAAGASSSLCNARVKLN